ncbi:hypothetical protein [Microlunatus speluncae]|uniref:hypothetical protein n=1 Tax=Microlunatus speluncae TaxID=2594267 RepID=UPI0012661D02|nr:hypothetical protein [Microlunatus speluncae]
MSQSAAASSPPATTSTGATAPAGPPAGPANAVVPAPAAVAVASSGAEAASLTPRRLRQLMAAVIIGGLLFGLFGAIGLGLQAIALTAASSNTDQLIRVQTIETDLLTADATATNAFLVGGLEPPGQRARYDQAIDSVNRLITEAARAQSADAQALAALNAVVSEYAVAIEQARANNRQGFPVGAQYLREASATLRADALPILDNLVAANLQRAVSEMTAVHPLLFQIAGVLILIGYVLGMVWLARRFKRTINVGLLVGGLTLLLSLIIGGIIVSATASAVDQLRTGSFSVATAAAEARIAAGDAKANESLTLIARGSGAAFEKAWQASATEVGHQLDRIDDPDLTERWQTYVAVHGQIRELDDGGRWDDAVAQATGSSGVNDANKVFDNFDAALAEHRDAAADQTASGLAGPTVGLFIGGLLIFAGGVVAAAFGRWGVAARLREYL